MAPVGRIRATLARLREPDEVRLAEETIAWAEAVPGSVRIGAAELRRPVRLAGVVRRLTVRPVEGAPTLEVVIEDGTGSVEVVWTGRSSIPGLTLGTGLVVDGIVAEHRAGRRVVNPRFEFAAPFV